MNSLLLNSSERTKMVARRRLETLKRFARLKKWHSATSAAKIVGVSVPTLWRWQGKFETRGLAGLRPKFFKSGRRSPFTKIRFTAQAVRELELLHIEHSGSPRAAWRRFVNSPSCPPMVARAVRRKGSAPAPLASIGRVSLVQARCYVSADGRRLFVKLPIKGVLTAQLAVPTKFNFVMMKK